MKRIIQLLLFALLVSNSYSQDFIHQFKKDKRIKKDKEFIKEFSTLSNKLLDSLNIALDSFDTLYIVRGVDIQSRSGYGLVWNNHLKIYYVDYKIWTGGRKLLDSNPQFWINQEDQDLEAFIDLVPLIEKWDTASINDYVRRSNEITSVISGLYWWRILKLEKKNKSYNIEQLWIQDFARIEE